VNEYKKWIEEEKQKNLIMKIHLKREGTIKQLLACDKRSYKISKEHYIT
jgi:hypothetical protein